MKQAEQKAFLDAIGFNVDKSRSRPDESLAKGLKVITALGEVGTTSGNYHDCTMEGCRGVRLSVKWPDGKRTFPCTKGMGYDEDKKEWRMF